MIPHYDVAAYSSGSPGGAADIAPRQDFFQNGYVSLGAAFLCFRDGFIKSCLVVRETLTIVIRDQAFDLPGSEGGGRGDDQKGDKKRSAAHEHLR